MKREIKFRFWDLEKRKMIRHNIDGITQNSLGKSFSDNLRPIITINGQHCLPHWGAKCITMQFTGIKDPNGVEIFEGDIMQHANPFDIPFTVNWDEDSIGFVFDRGTTSYAITDPSFSVIGNIYENPELVNEAT